MKKAVILIITGIVLIVLCALVILHVYRRKVDAVNVIIPHTVLEAYYPPVQRIPRHILQTHYVELDNVTVAQIKSLSVGYTYSFFVDADIEQYMLSHPIAEFPNMISKFRQLRGAHKADLFRYLWLYQNGGVFIDSDLMIYRPMDEILQDYEFVTAIDKHKKGAFTGILACAPRHPYMYLALRDAYETPIAHLKDVTPWFNDSPLQGINHYNYLTWMRHLKSLLGPVQLPRTKLYHECAYDPTNHYAVLQSDCSTKTRDQLVAIHYYNRKIVPQQVPSLEWLYAK